MKTKMTQLLSSAKSAFTLGGRLTKSDALKIGASVLTVAGVAIAAATYAKRRS